MLGRAPRRRARNSTGGGARSRRSALFASAAGLTFSLTALRAFADPAPVVIQGGAAVGNGGGVNAPGDYDLSGAFSTVLIDSNNAGARGGAIFSPSNIPIEGSAISVSITNNKAISQGGALYAGGNIILDGDFGSILIKSNTSNFLTKTTDTAITTGGGGGAFFAPGTITINDTAPGGGSLTVQANHAEADGGAFHAYNGFTLSGNYTDILIDSNTNARGMGGAIRVSNGPVLINTVTTGAMTMSNNTTAEFGAAIDAAYTNSTLTVLGSYGSISLTNNRATSNGGGAWGAGNNFLVDTNTTGLFDITGNIAKTSGGAFLGYYQNLTFSGTYGAIRVDSNKVTNAGSGPAGGSGGAFFTAKDMLLNPVVAGDFAFTGNTAGGNGGALATDTGDR